MSGSATDRDAARDFLRDILAGLGDEGERALAILAVPHWLPASAVVHQFQAEVLAVLPELIRRDLVRVTGSGALAVPDSMRPRLIACLTTAEQIAALATRLIPIFQAQGTPEGQIEAYYHELILGPEDASRRMFRTALALGAEPYFAYELLKRLIDVWREFDARWGLGGGARYLRTVELFTSSEAKPQEEVAAINSIDGKNDPLLSGILALQAGVALTMLNKIESARQHLTEALQTFESIGDLQNGARANGALGQLLTKIDHYDEARRFHERALELSCRLNHPVAQAESRYGLAEIETFTGNLARAREEYMAAIDLLEAHAGRTAEANARVGVAQVLVAQGELELAEAHLDKAAATFKTLDQDLGYANSVRGLALVYIEAGKLAEALEKNAEAQEIYADLETMTGTAACQELDGRIQLLSGHFDRASASLDLAEANFAGISDRYSVAACLGDKGALALAQDDRDAAARLLIRSADQFREIGAQLDAALSTFLAWLIDRNVAIGDARQRLTEAQVALPRVYWRGWTKVTGQDPAAQASAWAGLWESVA